MERLDVSTIQSQPGLSDRFKTWLDQIAVPVHPGAPSLPDDEAADAILASVGIVTADREACLAGRPHPKAHPEVWWILCHAYRQIVVKMGHNLAGGWYMGWPSLPDRWGPVGQQLYVWVCLAAVPDAQRFHQERGIPSEVTHASVSHLGYEISAWRQVSGQPGINASWMLPLILQGASYRLGRHAFDRYGNSLNVHVPAGESLAPVASQASFDWAREFFPRHFPEDAIETFDCHSWLLDDQWAEYLPVTSNIIQFQRRFTVDPDEPGELGDNDILQFVFHRESNGATPSAELLNNLPQDTTLQRAYVSHLRNGGHWWTRNGWFPFSEESVIRRYNEHRLSGACGDVCADAKNTPDAPSTKSRSRRCFCWESTPKRNPVVTSGVSERAGRDHCRDDDLERL